MPLLNKKGFVQSNDRSMQRTGASTSLGVNNNGSGLGLKQSLIGQSRGSGPILDHGKPSNLLESGLPDLNPGLNRYDRVQNLAATDRSSNLSVDTSSRRLSQQNLMGMGQAKYDSLKSIDKSGKSPLQLLTHDSDESPSRLSGVNKRTMSQTHAKSFRIP